MQTFLQEKERSHMQYMSKLDTFFIADIAQTITYFLVTLLVIRKYQKFLKFRFVGRFMRRHSLSSSVLFEHIVNETLPNFKTPATEDQINDVHYRVVHGKES